MDNYLKNTYWVKEVVTIIGWFLHLVVGFSQQLKPKVLTNNMLTKQTVKVLWGERKMSRKFANKGGKRCD